VPALTLIDVAKVAVRQPVPDPVAVAVPSSVPVLVHSFTVFPVLAELAKYRMAVTFPARDGLNRTPTVVAAVELTFDEGVWLVVYRLYVTAVVVKVQV
jgi:hypothetical protein